MAIVINGQTGIDAGHLPISNAGNTEVEGTLTAQGQNVSPFSGFKNYIVNGNFDVWQYGTSQTTKGYGSDDRWDSSHVGSTKTHSQIACTDAERALFNANYFSRTIVTSVYGLSNYVLKRQLVEDVTRLAGKTVTLSFWAKADSNKNIAIEFRQHFGTGGAPSSQITGIGSQLVALTNTWQKKTVTVTLPSMIGKTVGTDGVSTSYTVLNFWFDAGSNYNVQVANLGQQSGTFDIAQVQLEEGNVATPLENRPYGLELSLCQRYYQKIDGITGVRVASGYVNATTSAYLNGNLLSYMRTQPTLVTSGIVSDYSIATSNTSVVCSALPALTGSNNGYLTFMLTAASGLTVGQGCQLRFNASSYLAFNAEL